MPDNSRTPLLLQYSSPAAHWNEALPLGNGRLGAMVFGRAGTPRIHLNEDTLYSGEPDQIYEPPFIGDRVAKVREMLEEKRFAEAQEEVRRHFLGRQGASYQPAGTLNLTMKQTGEVTGYNRALDIEKAVHTEIYRQNEITFRRDTFVSHPDQIVVMHLAADQAGAISFDAHFDSVHPTARTVFDGNLMALRGQAPSFSLHYGNLFQRIEQLGDQHKFPELYDEAGFLRSYVTPDRLGAGQFVLYNEDGQGRGMFFEAALKVDYEGGSCTWKDHRLMVRGADRVTLRISAATSFNGVDKSPSREGADPEAQNRANLKAAEAHDFAALKARHVADFAPLMRRVDLRLGDGSSPAGNTDERLARFQAEGDPALAALLFQYGRYLLVSASRPGTQAAHLQGIWSDANVPIWSSNHTININTEMNYWPAEVTNLSELHEPLFDMIEELAVSGASKADSMFGLPGWMAFHNTSIWRETNPTGNSPQSAFWPMAAGWLLSHMWEHYLFTRDREFLKQRAFPLMVSACAFFLEWLVEDKDGFLVTPVSTSPENNYLDENGKDCCVSQGSTMDMAIIRELFARTAKCCELLDEDAVLRQTLEERIERLLPYRIGGKGQLQEWHEDYPDWNPHHRHVSHLYGVFPGDQITEATPDLQNAARQSLDIRGDEATGWSMGWKIALHARLGDGERAYRILHNFLEFVENDRPKGQKGGVYANLLCSHPPFQIDGNFGYTAGVAEMLLHSHNGKVVLLPSLPAAWSEGSVSGLKARGDYEIAMVWCGGQLKNAKIKARHAGKLVLETRNLVECKSNTTLLRGTHFVLEVEASEVVELRSIE
ncbi:glycoside hydrolase family 95 protein [Roseibium sp. SCP14]|uniref:glycoside hydrolase family 95 protein n=1 Tax=Roseibium sp. SCP14 TaxID=3141375 RepID=UPI00333C9FA4